jgi:hypothetical protein
MVKQSIKEKSSVKPALSNSAKTAKAAQAKKVTSKKAGKENARSSATTAQQSAKPPKQKSGHSQVARNDASHNVDELLARIKELEGRPIKFVIT